MTKPEGLFIDEIILDSLATLARTNGLSLSALLDEILRTYLETHDPKWRTTADKRRFQRKKVIIPAMVFESSQAEYVGRYHSTTIVDISFGGIRMSFPLERDGKIELAKSGGEFEVIFTVSSESEPIRFRCKMARIDKKGHSIQVGASFAESDISSHELLQKYLM